MGNKIKAVKSGGNSFFVFQSEKNQSLSERELYIINSGSVVGVLPITVENKGKAIKLTYNVTGYVTVRDYIKNSINKAGFAVLLSNIVESLSSMDKAFLKLQFAIFDIDFVMVNPATQKIYFPFVPIQFYENETTLKEFLLSIANNCNFIKSEDTSYVGEYIKILKSGINFSFFDLAEYAKNLSSGSLEHKGKLITCVNCKANFAYGTNFCPVCGTKIGTQVELPDNIIYNPIKGINADITKPQPIVNHEKIIQQKEIDTSYIIIGSVNDTVSFLSQKKIAVLCNCKTGEQIQIQKTPFVLGKDASQTDYCINNNAVSRRHAQIIFENNTYLFMDLGSTNKSFINGKMLPKDIKVPLINGMSIILANENFIFYIY